MKRKGSFSNRKLLHRRLASCEPKHQLTVGTAVDYLRSNYSDYARQKVQSLTFLVQDVLDRSNSLDERIRPRDDDEIHEYDNPIPARKKSRKWADCEGESAMSSMEEDVIYGEGVEPEFDLMKSMLRANYGAGKFSSNLVGEKPKVNVSVELGLQKGKGVSSGETKKQLIVGPTFRDFGGIDDVLKKLRKEVIFPFRRPELLSCLGAKPISGILLHGPPGCGKTTLAHAIANEARVPFYKMSASEAGGAENIRDVFSKAYRTSPSIVFIDEIDSICSKKENLQRVTDIRTVTQLQICMDESSKIRNDEDSSLQSSDDKHGYVLVIGATNRPDVIEPALRRPGRFTREIYLGVPDENARFKMLSMLTRKKRHDGSFDLLKLAKSTGGFVGADLEAITDEAAIIAIGRIADRKESEFLSEQGHEELTTEWMDHPWSREEIEKLGITMADYEEAKKKVQPSLTREGFSTIPDVKWEDVGGLDSLRYEFKRYIVDRIRCTEKHEKFRIDLQTGFLLYGPPGCGKTHIAKAVANEAGANFIHIEGAELLNKYVGESELAIRTVFRRARNCAPCIIFFDEIDAWAMDRGKEQGSVVRQMLMQLLAELDGKENRRGVFVIAATNRLNDVDEALLRNGRLGKHVYVPLPNAEGRVNILKAIGRKFPIDDDVDFTAIGRNTACENLSGADLSHLVTEAALLASEEQSSTTPTLSTVKMRHLQQAVQNIVPSESNKQKQRRCFEEF